MKPSQPSNRRRRETRPAAEALESRQLLTGGAGDTFAIEGGTISKANQPAVVKFTIDPTHFTLPKGKFTLGIDIAAASGSNLKPQIAAVITPNGTADPLTRGRYAKGLPARRSPPGRRPPRCSPRSSSTTRTPTARSPTR